VRRQGARQAANSGAEPKSERSRRRIAIPAPLADALRAHRAAQHAERLKAGLRNVLQARRIERSSLT
jgi:hypothetical protein